MARMIPPRVDGTTPRSERRVFELLREDPATADWTVLHSLGLARRGVRQPYGEIDFVVLVPGKGIVCLEVKGGRVQCEDGIWSTTSHHGQTNRLARSPFQQAREGMFALRRSVLQRFDGAEAEAHVIFGAAVVFPDVEAPPLTPEFERWELLDASDLRRPIGASIVRVLAETASRLGGRRDTATPAVLKSIRNFLRPDFDRVVGRATTIQRSEDRLLRLTNEQYDALDLLQANERCIVEGPAGTGKTMLALEYARRASAEGQKVLLLCYNRLLGYWLARRADDHQCAFTAGSLHQLVRTRILESALRDEFLAAENRARNTEEWERFFSEEYALFGQLALSEANERFDLIVVDEAQDILTTGTLAVLDKWAAGGLAAGRWAFLGDFTRQAIYAWHETRTEPAVLLAQYGAVAARLPLRRNCRNTRAVGEETALLSGFPALPYRLDGSDCLPVDYRYWSTAADQGRKLRAALDQLIESGVAPNDIVLLSPHQWEKSAASAIASGAPVPVRQLLAREGLPDAGGAVFFSTIHAFKGMESPVVILCDFASIGSDVDRSLLYVGMSRARSHLVLLMQERLREMIADAVMTKLAPGWTND